MNIEKIIEVLTSHFSMIDDDIYNEESGITYDGGRDIKRIGYATNLTLEVVEMAIKQDVDLLMTHYRMRYFNNDFNNRCRDLLKEHRISHYYNHLPLDDAPFGTNSSLAKVLNLVEVKKVNEDDGFMCGLIAETNEQLQFEIFVERVKNTLGEPVLSWKFNDRPIKRIHIVCGGGHRLSDMSVAKEEECDLYLTGEKMVYTVEYAKYNNLNLIVASHTFTEIFGVVSMAEIIKKEYDELDFVWLKESHFEANGIQ